MNLVSVIVPVYNVESYLRKCLDSIINQTYKNIEIICVDDASNDGSLKILKEYEKKDSRVIVLINSTNKGLSYSRYIGTEKSRGDYITFIDSDDYVGKSYIGVMLKEFGKGADIVCASFYIYINNRKICKVFEDGIYDSNDALKKLFLSQISWVAYSKMYKRSLFLGDNAHVLDIRLYEDICMNTKLFLKSKTISFVDKKIYYYIAHREGSISNNEVGSSFLADNAKAITNIKKSLEKASKYEKYKLEFSYLVNNLFGASLRNIINTNNSKVSVEELYEVYKKHLDQIIINNTILKLYNTLGMETTKFVLSCYEFLIPHGSLMRGVINEFFLHKRHDLKHFFKGYS